ncbi:MAG: trypsin-like peptidase domain-containing protein [Pirellulales bacterium]|nr:trypsin-like peptidase domain-containing protein [Pirellulales bacterium]
MLVQIARRCGRPVGSIITRSRLAVALALSLSLCGLVASTDASELRRSAIVRAVQGAAPSVVNINGEKVLSPGDAGFTHTNSENRVNGMGTGVIIDDRGYIITNFHVVDGVEQIKVTLANRETMLAKVVSNDPSTDLAIIKIDSREPLPVLKIGTSKDLMAGETVIAVGNAFGYEHTVTVGIISALHRSVQVGDAQKYEDLIQTDASINPGNSGGPLLNIDGDLIGINVAVRVGAQGIGFAIPIDTALEVAADLLSTRRVDHTWHGVVTTSAEDVDDRAVVVAGFDDESPAARSGLKVGDRIQSIAGRRVERPCDLERAMLGHRPGDEIEIDVVRASEETTVKLVLAGVPESMRAPTGDPFWEVLGVRLKTIPSKQFQRHGTRYRGGLAITAVRPDGPAARQGIRRGDVLVGMHVWETISLENVSYILNRPDFAKFEPVKFYILRGNETLYGSLSVSRR